MGRRWLLVAGLVGLLVVGGWWARSGVGPDEEGSLSVDQGPRGDDGPSAPSGPETTPWTELGEVRGAWTQREDAPIDVPGDHRGVWTGNELIVGFQPDVAAYDPAAERWRRLPDVPGPRRIDPRVVWTGQHVVVFGGIAGDEAGAHRADGLLLDVAGERWESMPPAPAAPLWDPTVVWTGEEVVVWGGARPGDAEERGEWAVNGSAYDPDRRRWREIAPAPVERVYHSDGLWTGRQLVVWGSHHPPGRQFRDEAGPSFAAAYDPAADRWQRLPAPPVEHPAEAAGMWTGREVILWGQPALAHRSGAPRVGASLDPRAVGEGWRLLPAVDVDTRPSTSVYGLSHAWASAGAVFYGGYPESVGLVYDPDDRSWLRLPSHRARVNAVAVWTGEELLLWGGYTTTGPDRDLWSFRPQQGRPSCGYHEASTAQVSPPTGWTWWPSPLSRPPDVAAWTGTDVVAVAGRQAAAGDPATGQFRCLPASPLHARTKAAGTWTPAGLFVWGTDSPSAEAAVYDPASETWRTLPKPPLSPREPVAVHWTGEEVLVWGDTARGHDAGAGAAYAPATDTWRELPDAPAPLNGADSAWTGEELIVYGAALDDTNAADTVNTVGVAYSPGDEAWRPLPDHALSPQGGTVAWTGEVLVAVDYLRQAAAYDPGADEWAPLPPAPFPQLECHPDSAVSDGRVVVSYCGHAGLFDLDRQDWTDIPTPTDLDPVHVLGVDDGALFLGQRGVWRLLLDVSRTAPD